MSTKPSRSSRTPPALLAVMLVIVAVLIIASAATGQWWITVLGLIALGAAAVPFLSRR
jgi:hypothetical protein